MKMYNGKISDDDVKIFHQSEKVTATYTELNSALFDKSKANKCFLKFYTDEIQGNANIRIIDNKLIIYSSDNDLDSVYFHNKDNHKRFKVLHNITESILFLHFYDKDSLFNLANYNFNISQSGTNGIKKDIQTDIYGNITILLKSTSGSCTITNLETGEQLVI